MRKISERNVNKQYYNQLLILDLYSKSEKEKNKDVLRTISSQLRYQKYKDVKFKKKIKKINFPVLNLNKPIIYYGTSEENF